jgi:hypothetical protein
MPLLTCGPQRNEYLIVASPVIPALRVEEPVFIDLPI